MSLAAYWDQMQKTAAEEIKEEETVDKVATATELLNSMNQEELETLFGKESEAEATTETAETEEPEDEKVAEDLIAAGRIMAQGFLEALNTKEE